MNINININTIANLATGFIEAYYWCVLCDTFMKRYLKLPKYVYIICVVCLGALIDTVNSIFSITVMNIVIIICIEILFSSILQVLCKYKIVQKNLFKWTELNSVRFYVIRKISTCQ